MLDDKSRQGLRHLKPRTRRKWSAFHSGQVIRLPRTVIRGGWASGLYDWYPWQILGFSLTADKATVQSLSDRRVTKEIQRRDLAFYEDHPQCPFGSTNPTRQRPVFPWWKPKAKAHKRYV